MRTSGDDTTPIPPNAFAADYLALLSPRNEPVTAAEADTAGPWHPVSHPWGGWAVLREGTTLSSRQPRAIFTRQDAARLAAAVIPATGRRPRYRLGKEPDALGYPVFDEAELVGHFEHFDEALLAALNFADALVSVPHDLAWLLDAAGGPALEQAGQIAVERAVIPEF